MIRVSSGSGVGKPWQITYTIIPFSAHKKESTCVGFARLSQMISLNSNISLRIDVFLDLRHNTKKDMMGLGPNMRILFHVNFTSP
jgi:hypothetical protein